MTKSEQHPERPPKPDGDWKWVDADWAHPCISCGAVPTMPETEMCGACTFGEADAYTDLVIAGGYWAPIGETRRSAKP